MTEQAKAESVCHANEPELSSAAPIRRAAAEGEAMSECWPPECYAAANSGTIVCWSPMTDRITLRDEESQP